VNSCHLIGDSYDIDLVREMVQEVTTKPFQEEDDLEHGKHATGIDFEDLRNLMSP
jgi:hypothetical protein